MALDLEGVTFPKPTWVNLVLVYMLNFKRMFQYFHLMISQTTPTGTFCWVGSTFDHKGCNRNLVTKLVYFGGPCFRDAQAEDPAECQRPIATPCRGDGDGDSQIPELDDETVEAPKPGKIRLSQSAIDSRLRRVFQPSVDGKYKVPMEVVKQWQCKRKGRKSLEQIFQSCGFSPDRDVEMFWIVSFATMVLQDNIFTYLLISSPMISNPCSGRFHRRMRID